MIIGNDNTNLRSYYLLPHGTTWYLWYKYKRTKMIISFVKIKEITAESMIGTGD